jgi:outer membrane protein TolC
MVLAMPLASFAAPPTLSLEEATRVAVERAPMLDARRAQIQAAEQESRRAGALPDPMLMVGINNLPVTGTDAFDAQADFMTMKRIGLRQKVPARAKREAQRSMAARKIDEAQADTQAERLEVRRETAEAWIDLWAAQRELDELMALREETRLASRLARARVAGGADPVADALAAEAALLELDNRVEMARASEEAARVGLARWVGDARLLSMGPTPDFTTLPVSPARLLAALDQLGPLLPTTAQIETAAAAVDVARAERSADWSVAASYGQRGGGRSDMFMLEFSIELPLFPRNRQNRGIAARQAEYEAALATREDLRRQQAAHIHADIARWEGFKRQVARDRNALLPLARDRTATALAAYRAGAPVRPWLDAQHDELDILFDHTQRLDALGRAWAALAYLLPQEPQQ